MRMRGELSKVSCQLSAYNGGSYEIMIKKDNRVDPLVLWVAGYILCYLETTISAGRVALSKLSITNKQYLAVLMLRSFVDPVSLGWHGQTAADSSLTRHPFSLHP